MDKRHFTVVIGSKEHGLYVSSKPSSAAKKAVSKLCAANKSKKVEFSLREITQGSKKKTYGPYVGEMKKLKKPIELKGRVIRHEIKVHLKKGKRSTIKTAKKMRGGEENEPIIPLNENMDKFERFIRNYFRINNRKKLDMIQRIGSLSKNKQRKVPQYMFYIFRIDPKPTKIISVGVISGNATICRLLVEPLEAKNYLFLRCLLSREIENSGLSSAIYHILSKLPETYSGICLSTIDGDLHNYTNLGFTEVNRKNNLINLILDKTPENIERLKEIIGQITTEFYSTYPDNIIT
jgi:hypothetical protein